MLSTSCVNPFHQGIITMNVPKDRGVKYYHLNVLVVSNRVKVGKTFIPYKTLHVVALLFRIQYKREGIH